MFIFLLYLYPFFPLGNLLSSDLLKDALDGVTSVVCFFLLHQCRKIDDFLFYFFGLVSYAFESLQISCVGGFGSNSYMYKINGTANINAIRAASEKGVKRFVYISAADFGLAKYLLSGYYEGKVSSNNFLHSPFFG